MGVVDILQYLFSAGSTPRHLRSDNGPEFVSQTVRCWPARSAVKTLFIATGSPGENGYIGSVGGKLRDELFSRELFFSQEEARGVIDRWRLDFNHHRIHGSLEYQVGVGRTGYPVPPPSEPYVQISRIRLSGWWYYLRED